MYSPQYSEDPRSGPKQIRSLREFAAEIGVSVATLRRLIAAGDGPRITHISARRTGVRNDHGQEWLDARAS